MRVSEIQQALNSDSIFSKIDRITDDLRNAHPNEEIDEVFDRYPRENLKTFGLTLLLIPILPAETVINFLSRLRKKIPINYCWLAS